VPEFLNEDYVTVAPELIFPNVQTCCAVVVSATGVNDLGGYHMTMYTKKREFDRAVLHLKTEIGGAVDGVYVVGNVLGRPGNQCPGLDSLMELKSAMQTGLGYAFDVRYHDIGANNQGTAVRAWRDGATNQVRLAISPNGSWVAAPHVVPMMGMIYVRETMAAAMDGNTGTKLRVTRPLGTVKACTINAENPILRFSMPNL
jgi:hypothetical protein